jgi:hypothetical protein
MRCHSVAWGTEVLNDNFSCTWTLCSTQSGDGWPQRSQLQPGVPSLGRCATLLPVTFCNPGRSSGLVRIVEIDKAVLVVAHRTLWRQSFNYLPADNNIAGSVAGDYPRTYHVEEIIWSLVSSFVHDFCPFVELLPSKFPSTAFLKIDKRSRSQEQFIPGGWIRGVVTLAPTTKPGSENNSS